MNTVLRKATFGEILAVTVSELLEEIQGIQEEAVIRGLTPLQVFFERYSEVSTERGDGPDFDPCFFRGKTAHGGSMRLDGWALETFAADRGRKGVNVYAIGCFFDDDLTETRVIGAQGIDKCFNEIRRAVEHISRDEFLSNSEITDEGVLEFAFQLKESAKELASIKLLVFSNSKFETQRKVLSFEDIAGVSVKAAVLDWDEYQTFSTTGNDPIVIDLGEVVGAPVPCIETASNSEVSSYLLALEGNVIADLFHHYDNRLLESNVRTYLQARTMTNKGILKTIAEEPHLFFAYNNGITATASAAEFVETSKGLQLVELTDLQIVNGGQTTASLLYAREQNRSSLDGIKVQVKLNIISDGATNEFLVPNISRYSNSQNKVSEADLISNHAFQSDIERVIKNLVTPKLDRMIAPNWFYERARGQYNSLFTYKRAGERDRLKTLYPKDHSITKTDLAKFYMSVERQPHWVAKGAQKCFLEFSKLTAKAHSIDKSYINEAWAHDVIARAILFRQLDSAISRADWYKADRGFKSQIVTYTIAGLSEFFRQRNMVIDTKSIWLSQQISPHLLNILVDFAFAVGKVIKDPPTEKVRNPGEFAKAAYCWNLYVSPLADELDEYLERFGMPDQEWKDWIKSSQESEATVNDIQLWEEHLKIIPELKEVVGFLKRTDLYSREIDRAFSRLFKSRYEDGDGAVIAECYEKYQAS